MSDNTGNSKERKKGKITTQKKTANLKEVHQKEFFKQINKKKKKIKSTNQK